MSADIVCYYIVIGEQGWVIRFVSRDGEIKVPLFACREDATEVLETLHGPLSKSLQLLECANVTPVLSIRGMTREQFEQIEDADAIVIIDNLLDFMEKHAHVFMAVEVAKTADIVKSVERAIARTHYEYYVINIGGVDGNVLMADATTIAAMDSASEALKVARKITTVIDDPLQKMMQQHGLKPSFYVVGVTGEELQNTAAKTGRKIRVFSRAADLLAAIAGEPAADGTPITWKRKMRGYIPSNN